MAPSLIPHRARVLPFVQVATVLGRPTFPADVVVAADARSACPKRDFLRAVGALAVCLFIEIAPDVNALSAADCTSGSALYALLAIK